jgi:hemoglobin
MSETQPPTRPTLYAYLGPHLIDALVDRLYARILKDARLAPFFAHMDLPRLRTRMKEFITFVTGGPSRYRGADLRTAHVTPVAMGMRDEHFDLVIATLVEELRDFSVAEDRIAELGAIVESARRDVLNR